MTDTTLVRLDEQPSTDGGRLGRHLEHDPASREHDVEPRGVYAPPKPQLWPRFSPILDQGDLGSCTGNALTGWLGCGPHVSTPADAAQYDEAFAVARYERATQVDPWPGTYPPDDTGSSGLAVCKAAKHDGVIARYSWAFTVNGLLHALQSGPVIVGVPWYEGFDRPDQDGLVAVAGGVRGGHEFLIRGVQPAAAGGPLDGTARLWADNSWSAGWGRGGSFEFTVDTWAQLRADGADVAVPRLAA